MATKTKEKQKKGGSDTVYRIVTEKILGALEEGVVPWRKPWTAGPEGGHANLNSKRPYTGINQLLLQLSPYEQPWWLTFAGAKRLGGHVAKDEHSTLVVFSRRVDVRDQDSEDPDAKKRIYLLRYYKLWNVEQCVGLDDAIPPPPPDDVKFDPVAKADRLVKDYRQKFHGPPIKHGTMAVYAPRDDLIVVPRRSAFEGAADYYGTTFHEVTHSTGHPSRLDRDLSGGMGSDSYSREELVAEIGSAMLCALVGLTPNYQASASYIDHWRAKLEDDPKLIVSAAATAQRAADYVQGIKRKSEED